VKGQAETIKFILAELEGSENQFGQLNQHRIDPKFSRQNNWHARRSSEVLNHSNILKHGYRRPTADKICFG
jgi:hypothetical protein